MNCFINVYLVMIYIYIYIKKKNIAYIQKPINIIYQWRGINKYQ